MITKKQINKKASQVSEEMIVADIKKMRKEPGYYSSVMKDVEIINELWSPFILPNPRGIKRK